MTDIKQANLLEYLRHIRKGALTKEAKETLVKTVKETYTVEEIERANAILDVAQQGLFLVEFQPVRFLRHAPRTVPAPFDIDIAPENARRTEPVVIHDFKRRGHIFLLRDDRYSAGVDINHGQPREADQADPVFPLLAAFVPDRQHDRARKIHLGFSAGDLLRPHINPLAFEFELGDEHLVLHHE